MKPSLSVLICSTESRATGCLPDLIGNLRPQLDRHPDVELISIIDNRWISVGQKRNSLIAMANGTYLTFIDDDDAVAIDYVSTVLQGISSGADVICFNALYSPKGGKKKLVDFSREHSGDSEIADRFLRIPNHLMVWRSDLAKSLLYPDVNFGEDATWAKMALGRIRTEHKINKTLYTYQFDGAKSEAKPNSKPKIQQ